MLGPGTNITHAAIKTACDSGCSIVWCGENGARFYAYGQGETRSAKNTLIQAKYCMDENMPHAGGDEPSPPFSFTLSKYVCPTQVGMNRSKKLVVVTRLYVCPTQVGMNRLQDSLPTGYGYVCPTQVGMNRWLTRL